MNATRLVSARWVALLFGGALGLSGCEAAGPTGHAGQGEPPGPSSPPSTPVGDTPGGVEVDCAAARLPAPTPLMKLSTRQYRNTVVDLLAALGASSALPSVQGLLESIPDDSLADGFRGRDNRTSIEHVQGYLNVGRGVADAVAKDAKLLGTVAGACATEAALSATCVDGFLERFGRLVYRRPLTALERADYAALNDGVRSPAEAIRAMIIVALSSPQFVHQVEVDGTPASDASDVLKLTAHELAARLSYTFWQSMPDASLFAAADDGSLLSEDGFQQQLERVFADPRTRETLWSFWNEWFGLEKFTGFEATRPALKALASGEALGEPGHDHYGDMVQELRDLTELFGPSPLSELLTTDLSVTRSADLAHLYGIAPYAGSGDYPRFPAGTRAGLLQRAALLVSNLEQTNPFHRGAFVRRNLLCDPLPQPDPNSLPPGALDPPQPSAAQTTRERYQAKIEGNALCQGCHQSFADIGYALESFDALGRYRTVEQIFDEKTGSELAKLPLETSAVARVTPDDLIPVEGAADLNQRLVASGKVQLCFAQRYFEFAARRAAQDASLDGCVVRDLATAVEDPKVGLSRAFMRMAQYQSFFLRKVAP
jgi:Protein of unknown function (DUF1588)/Protein of unknown function (DUF1592)/Protein of unknown function (DUF1595)/Protein of unknown function (DUF1587)